MEKKERIIRFDLTFVSQRNIIDLGSFCRKADAIAEAKCWLKKYYGIAEIKTILLDGRTVCEKISK